MKVIKDCLYYTFPFLLFLVFYPINLAAQENPIIYLEWYENPLETMVINWIGDAGANRTVEYRRRGSSENWNSHTASVNNLPNTSKLRYRQKITGLSPGTSYEFRIHGISGTRYFRTAPPSIEEPIQFIVGGDITETRGNNVSGLREIFEAVTDIAAKYNPLFVTVGGDWVHSPGDYPDVEDWFYLLETWTEKLITVDGSYMIPIFGSAGNHEVPDYGSSPEDAIFYHAFLSYPQEQWGEKRGYGVVDFADYLSIVTLDTNLMHSVRSQNSWLQQTLSDRENVPHVYPVYHVPGWPTFRTMRDGTGLIDDIRNEWHPFFRDHGIRMVFEHHDHSFKRTYPFICTPPIINPPDCTVDEENGVIYTGGGTWGSVVRDLHPNFTEGGDQWVHQVNELENNFVLMEISERKRTLRAVSLNRGIVDTFDEVFYLPSPVVHEASEVMPNSFIANWEPVPDAQHYRLDVSKNSNFTNFIDGYYDQRIEGMTSHEVTGLDPDQTYYFRVRARTPPTVSDHSETIEVQTIRVDPNQSTIAASSNIGEANNHDAITITVTARDENGMLLRNVPVELITTSGNLIVSQNNIITNDEGQVDFEVRNDRPETVVYGAIAAVEMLSETVSVSFIPEAPVVLSASEVDTRRFFANWEVVNGADSYKLDVATDSSFTDYVSGYQNLDVGNVTSYQVTGVFPGTDYIYRIRAISEELTGADSDPVAVITYPEIPIAVDATDVNAISFTANWEPAEGARSYILDIATDESFEHIVEENQNIDSINTSYRVTDLELGRNYFYRVKSGAGHRVSEESDVIQTKTLNIDLDNTEISSSQLRVLANGEQVNEITVEVKNEDGIPLRELNTVLEANNGSSEIREIQQITNENGIAKFGVTNTIAEKVTFSATVQSVPIGEITVEFLDTDIELTMGDNFPNPFSDITKIPIMIPAPKHVQLTVYNSLGMKVRTLLDEELNTGYHEVSFHSEGLAAGVYFYRLIAGEKVISNNMVLVK